MIRKIIEIDKEKCNGCGLCAHACHEGAIGMVDGKATLLRDDYCDGLGNCLPVCPTGAICSSSAKPPLTTKPPCRPICRQNLSRTPDARAAWHGVWNAPRSISRPRSFRCRASCASGRCRSSSCR